MKASIFFPTLLTAAIVAGNAHATVTLFNGADVGSLPVGGNLTLTLTVTNSGPADATQVLVIDTLSPGVNVVSISNTVGAITQSVNTVTWMVGTVASGEVETATLVVTPTTVGTITNDATIGIDGGPQGAPAEIEITVVPAGPDLSASIEVTDTTCTNTTKAANCTIGGTIELLNNGAAYLSADFTLSQSSKLPPKVGSKIKGVLNLTHLDPTGIPSHTIAFYLSNDDILDPSDTLVAAGTTKAIQKAFSHGVPAKVKFKVPSGVSVSGKFLILVVDATHVVSEPDESNNTAVFGPLP